MTDGVVEARASDGELLGFDCVKAMTTQSADSRKTFSLSSGAKGRRPRFIDHLLTTVLRQRRVGLCVATLGLILGAFAGLWLGRGMLLRAAKADLSDYAQQLSRNADALRGELRASFSELNRPSFPPCSDADLWDSASADLSIDSIGG